MKYMGMQLKMKVPKPTYRETPVRLTQGCCYREIFRDAIAPMLPFKPCFHTGA